MTLPARVPLSLPPIDTVMRCDKWLRSTFMLAVTVGYILGTTWAFFFIMATLGWIYYFALPLRFFCPRLWWELVDTLYMIVDRCLIVSVLWWPRYKMIFYGDFKDVRHLKENVVIISNHQSELDIQVVSSAIEKTGDFPRHRYVAKEPLLWLPFLGFFSHDRGHIYVERGNTNWKNFDRACRRLKRPNMPASVVVFPEGTIMNWALEKPAVREAFRSIARKNGCQPFEHVLFPKHRGFHRVLNHLEGQLDAVYDLTIMYSCTRGPAGEHGMAPSFLDFIQSTNSTIHVHLRRIDINAVPKDEEGVKQFLIERFAIKEQFLTAFHNTGAVPGEGRELGVQSCFYNYLCSFLLVASFCVGVSPLVFLIGPFYAFPSLAISYVLGFFFIVLPEGRSCIGHPFAYEATIGEKPPDNSK